MKKAIAVFLLLVSFVVIPHAMAEEAFALDDRKVYAGMDLSYAQGYVPSVEGGAMNLIVPVKTVGIQGSVAATLTILSPALSPFIDTTLQKVVKPDDKGNAYKVAFTLPMKRASYNGVYPATLLVEGKNAAGEVLSREFPLSLPLLTGLPEDTGAGLSVLEVVPEGDGLRPGEPGALRVRLKNNGERSALTDILLTVSDQGNSILPQGSHTMAGGELAPGEEQWVTVPVVLQPNAVPIPHVVNVNAQYRAFAGEVQSIARSFTVPVTQDMRLTYGKAQLPVLVTQGDLVNFTLPLMNMGKATVHNVLLTFSLPGLSEGESVLAGNIEPGGTVQGKATFQVSDGTLGETAGEVEITYEDAQGTQGRLTLPLQTEVVARKPVVADANGNVSTGAAPTGTPAKEMTLVERWWPLGVAALMLVVVLAQTAHYRGRIRRIEEQRL